ncbi:MAG: SOS response-associated peptidase [Cytophagales bacterium]|jgi:putative SOS response-associated peptidase YedK|nr:SOS response-associated peptidase [Cytophagales bacterium]MCA6366009.1 SOS response-associated peptidase [Cytophagales bacterium]MCA6376027.1 SOS response-associated peptidase [Cytophagales bacterium]
MIERFSVGVSASRLASRYKTEEPTFLPRYNGAPSQLFPVLTNESPQGFSYFYWGVAPQWAKNKSIAERLINVRAEQIIEKPVLAKSLKKYRCVIPADGFYAWKKVGKKIMIPWRFVLPSKELFSMAGIWEEYEEDGDAFHTFTIITTLAKGLSATVSDRQPLVLSKEDEAIWLKNDTGESELLALLKRANGIDFDGFTVSPQLNSIQFDRPSLLLPVPAADQFGNLTLFD